MTIVSIANNPGWAILFWVSFYSWFFLFETWVSMRDVRAKTTTDNVDGYSALFFLAMLYVGIFLSLAFAFLAPQFRIDSDSLNVLLFTSGIILIWAGIVFRLWSIQTLGKYFRTVVLIQDDHELITSGPYRYLRHPSYTGSMISVLGVGLALGNWMSLLSILLTVFIGYRWRIHVEEIALGKRFGAAYAAYRKKTWNLILFIW
ncbi:MAG: methyltransferase family protein [Minisyncoccota bacterium]